LHLINCYFIEYAVNGGIWLDKATKLRWQLTGKVAQIAGQIAGQIG